MMVARRVGFFWLTLSLLGLLLSSWIVPSVFGLGTSLSAEDPAYMVRGGSPEFIQLSLLPEPPQLEDERISWLEARTRPAVPLPAGAAAVTQRLGAEPQVTVSSSEPLQSEFDLKVFTQVSALPSGARTGSLVEPSVANNGKIVFFSTNSFAARSGDKGRTWQYVDPAADMPDFCCDTDVVYAGSRDVFIWYRQGAYWKGNRGFRLGVSGDAVSWDFYNYKPEDFASTWTGLWFDYPHLAVSSNLLFITSNVFYLPATGEVCCRFFGSVILRFSLDDLRDRVKNPVVWYYYRTDADTITPVQGATQIMYFGDQVFSGSNKWIRVFAWREATPQTVNWQTVLIHGWNLPEGSSCPSPDGGNMCGRLDHRIMTGWVTGGAIGFMWNAGPIPPSIPYAYIEAVLINEATFTYISGNPLIYSTDRAWAFPSASVNARGHVAIVALNNRPSGYPSTAYLVGDEISGLITGPNPFGRTFYVLTNGNSASERQSDGSVVPVRRWGDYIRIQAFNPPGGGFSWVASGYTIQSPSNIQPEYYVFGRVRDNPYMRKVTFQANGPRQDAVGAILTIDSVAYSVVQLPVTLSWEEESVHTVFVQEKVNAGTGKRYLFSAWTNPGTLAGLSGAYTTPLSYDPQVLTVAANYATQFQLSISGGSIVGTNPTSPTGDFWYNQGTNLQVRAAYSWNVVAERSRENLVSWALDGGQPTSVPRSGSGTFQTPVMVMDRPRTLQFKSITQYFLSVKGGRVTSITSSPTSDGWYDPGTAVLVGFSYVWDETQGQSRSNAISYALDGVNRELQRSALGTFDVSLSMNIYHVLTINSVRQFTLKVQGSASEVIPQSQTLDGWYDEGTVMRISHQNILSIASDQSSRVRLASYKIDGGVPSPVGSNTGATLVTVRMDAAHTVVFTTATQYPLTVSGGGAIGFSPPSATADTWFDGDTIVSVSTSYTWDELAGQSRQSLISWELDGQTSNVPRQGSAARYSTPSITMNSKHRVTLVGITQYFLLVVGGSVSVNPLSPTADRWYDSGSTVQVQAQYVWDEKPDGSRQNLAAWTLDGSRKELPRKGSSEFTTPQIPMNIQHSVTFHAVTQHILTVKGGSGIRPSVQSPTGDSWYDQGTDLTVFSDNVWDVVPTSTRLRLGSYSVDQRNPTLVSATVGSTPVTVLMNSAHTIQISAVVQYYLKVTSPYAEASGEGWYDVGTQAEIRVEPTIVGIIIRQEFDRWTGDLVSHNPVARITMDGPKQVSAVWGANYTQLEILLGIGGAVSAVVYFRRLRARRLPPTQQRTGRRRAPTRRTKGKRE